MTCRYSPDKEASKQVQQLPDKSDILSLVDGSPKREKPENSVQLLTNGGEEKFDEYIIISDAQVLDEFAHTDITLSDDICENLTVVLSTPEVVSDAEVNPVSQNNASSVVDQSNDTESNGSART